LTGSPGNYRGNRVSLSRNRYLDEQIKHNASLKDMKICREQLTKPPYGRNWRVTSQQLAVGTCGKKENIRLTRKVLNELGKLPRQDNVNALSPECCCIKHSHENDIRISFMFIKIR
jgi:hypothetical protein